MKEEGLVNTKDGLVTVVINKISAMALNMSEEEVKKLSKLIVKQPNLTKASMSMAANMGCKINWDVIMTTLVILALEVIDYNKIAKEIKFRLPMLNDDYIANEVEGLYNHLISVEIENNRSEIIKMESAINSKYKFTTITFRKLMFADISPEDFHKDIIELMVSIIKDDLNKSKYKGLVV